MHSDSVFSGMCLIYEIEYVERKRRTKQKSRNAKRKNFKHYNTVQIPRHMRTAPSSVRTQSLRLVMEVPSKVNLYFEVKQKEQLFGHMSLLGDCLKRNWFLMVIRFRENL